MNTQTSMPSKLGTHIILDVFGCDPNQLENVKEIYCLLKTGIIKSGSTILKTFIKKFEPQGLTIVFVLAESHVSIHTYPEHKTAMLDMFTCGERIDPNIISDFVLDHLVHVKYNKKILVRGTQNE